MLICKKEFEIINRKNPKSKNSKRVLTKSTKKPEGNENLEKQGIALIEVVVNGLAGQNNAKKNFQKNASFG
jgi:hypothetical protein